MEYRGNGRVSRRTMVSRQRNNITLPTPASRVPSSVEKDTAHFHNPGGNEENIENGSNPAASASSYLRTNWPRPVATRPVGLRDFGTPQRVGHRSQRMGTMGATDAHTRQEDDGAGVAQATIECPEAANVKQLKGWLSNFEKKQKEHFDKGFRGNQTASDAESKDDITPARPTESVVVMSYPVAPPKPVNAVPSVPVQRSTVVPVISRRPAPTPAPGAYTSTIVHSSNHAAVASAPSTPTKSRAVPSVATPVRTPSATPGGRRFGQPRIKKEEVQATDTGKASVQKLASWLSDDPFEKKKNPRGGRRGVKISQKARTFETDIPASRLNQTDFESGRVSDRKAWLQSAFKQAKEEEVPIENMTVSEKAKWLKDAFKRKEAIQQGAAVARSWQREAHARQEEDASMLDSDSSMMMMAQDLTSYIANSSDELGDDEQWSDNFSECANTEEFGQPEFEVMEPRHVSRFRRENNGGAHHQPEEFAPSAELVSDASSMMTGGSSVSSGDDIDATSISGKSAVQAGREMLIRREQEAKMRAADPKQMLRTTWETATPSGKSGVYQKKRMDAIPPKKRFADLP